MGGNPSRTAVDLDGNAWIGGRNDGRLTKILWDTSTCPDRNGDGVIQTSKNVGGVVNQINSAADPFADECVVYSDVPYRPRPVSAVWPWPRTARCGSGTPQGDPVHRSRDLRTGAFYDGANVPLWTLDAHNVLQRHGDKRLTPAACTDWSSIPGAACTRAPTPVITCPVSTPSPNSGSPYINGPRAPPTASPWTRKTASGPAPIPTERAWACSMPETKQFYTFAVPNTAA